MARRADRFLTAERAVTRWASFLRDVRDLTLEGSIEPRKWIGCAERFWLGMAEDTGDWLHVLGTGRDAAETDDAPDESRRYGDLEQQTLLPAGTRVHEIPVDIPLELFETLETEALTLRPSGLQCRDRMVATPGRNLRILPAKITSARRSVKLRLFDLPTLRPGMELWGMIWAEPTGGAVRPARRAILARAIRILVH
jgi:hypothetical protein